MLSFMISTYMGLLVILTLFCRAWLLQGKTGTVLDQTVSDHIAMKSLVYQRYRGQGGSLTISPSFLRARSAYRRYEDSATVKDARTEFNNNNLAVWCWDNWQRGALPLELIQDFRENF